MSSDAVIKSVARRLKYYFEVKRLEDGFDLSGVECPRLDHPPMRNGPTLAYDGIHDRSLKHYFSLPEVRHALTQFRAPEHGSKENKRSESKSPSKKQSKSHNSERQSNARSQSAGERQTDVNKKVNKLMRRYHFFVSPLSPQYYVYTRKRGRTLRPELNNTTLRKQQPPNNGGRPVLRSAPPDYVSKTEAKRLIETVSKLVVVTETAAVEAEKQENKEKEEKKKKLDNDYRAAPNSFETKKGNKESSNERRRNSDNYDSDQSSRSPESRKSTARLSGRTQSSRSQGNSRSPDSQTRHTGRQSKSRSGERSHQKQASNTTSKPRSNTQVNNKQPKTYMLKKVDNSRQTRNTTTKDEKKTKHNETNEIDVSRSDSALSNHSLSPRPPREKQENQAGTNRRNRPMSARKRKNGEEEQTQKYSLHSRSSRSQSHESLDSEYKREMEEAEKSENDTKQKNSSYEIRIYTDNEQASKLQGLKLILCGDKGPSEIQKLAKPSNIVTSGKGIERAIFDIETTSIGKLTGLKIGFDGKESELAPLIVSIVVIDRVKSDSYEVTSKEIKKILSLRNDELCYLVLKSQTEADEEDDASTSRAVSVISSPSHELTSTRENNSVTGQRSPEDDGHRSSNKETEKNYSTVVTSKPNNRHEDNDFFDQKVKSPVYNVQLDSSSPELNEKVNKSTGPPEGSSIWIAASKGDLVKVKQWVNYNEDFKTEFDERGRNVLHTAAACGQLEVLEWLTTVMSDIDSETTMGHTAIHLAAQHGHTPCVKLLISMAANKDCQTSGEMLTPLHCAVKGNHLETVECLVTEGANINLKDSKQNTPAQLAEQLKYTQIATYLNKLQATNRRSSTKSSNYSDDD